MGKRTVTRWYMGAWVVWIVSLIAHIAIESSAGTGVEAADVAFVDAAMLGSAVLMFVMWVVTLVSLARQKATLSFVVLVLLQFLGLGIIGMVAYGMSEPHESADVAIRPRVN